MLRSSPHRPHRLLAIWALLSLVATSALAACSSDSHDPEDPSAPTAGDGGAGVPGDASVALDARADDARTDVDSGADAGTSEAGPTDAAPTDASSVVSSPGALAYMIGIKCNSDESAPGTLEGWLARKTDIAGTTITTTTWIGGTNAAYTNSDGSRPLLEVSFPLLSIFGEQPALTDMSQAATGAYDDTYEAMSTALAAFPNPLLSARIGWELNGNWYPWSNGVTADATYASYVSAFRHAAVMLRKHNPQVLIQWNIAWGQPDPTPYWPGAYDANDNPGGVDVVSIDFYQANISQYNNGGKQSSWALAQSGSTINLDWMVAFAEKNGVKIALSEYGAGSPASNGLGSGAGLDDGTWTAASVAWINAQPAGSFLWTSWSDDEPADDIVTPGANPGEQAAWSAAWKGTHFGGSWWKGTAPPSASP
jgi:hypothetical protein